jgi:transcriptional regulator with PAS, ATPase and Fis domain
MLEKAQEGVQPTPLLPEPLKRAEAQTILHVLEKQGGNRKKTAEELGISVVTLWRKMKRLSL